MRAHAIYKWYDGLTSAAAALAHWHHQPHPHPHSHTLWYLHMSHDKSATETRALQLLGQGLSSSVVASALGVTESRISQLLSDSEFAKEVQRLRFENLQQSTAIDGKYSAIEDKLLDKLEKIVPLISKPRDVLAALSTVNGAKRRGATSVDTDTLQAKVVNLTLPVSVQQKFITNVNQQVTEVRDESGKAQTLVTASSGSLSGLAERMLSAPEKLPESSAQSTASEGSGKGDGDEAETYGSDLLSSL